MSGPASRDGWDSERLPVRESRLGCQLHLAQARGLQAALVDDGMHGIVTEWDHIEVRIPSDEELASGGAQRPVEGAPPEDE